MLFYVLIVPLWNWNTRLEKEAGIDTLVLIVPLWNWNFCPSGMLLTTCSSFNRTFMELKYKSKGINKHLNNVLIVPLWNWNKENPSEGYDEAAF